MNPKHKDDIHWYKKHCDIQETVWRSSRINDLGDELVVAYGTQDSKPGYFMAWEVQDNRSECISWNGKTSWYPRMFWEYVHPRESILIQDSNELLKERVPGAKRYWHDSKSLLEKDGDFYVKVIPFSETKTGKTIFKPEIQNDNGDALTRAIIYVQWFNENQRQLNKFNKLLSKSKKARKRRQHRLTQRLLKERLAVDNQTYNKA